MNEIWTDELNLDGWFWMERNGWCRMDWMLMGVVVSSINHLHLLIDSVGGANIFIS